MVKYLKNLFTFKKYNTELSVLVGTLHDEVTELKLRRETDLSNPTNYIQQIMKRDLSWFDYSKLDQARRITYYADCKNIVEGETFNNELNHYIADLIKFNANESVDFGAVMNIRASIVALETFKKRLESIDNPIKFKPEVDEFSPL